MKIVIKEWLKTPKAFAALVLALLIDIGYSIINAKLLITISSAMGDFNNASKYLPIIIVISILQMAMSALSTHFSAYAGNKSFTVFMDRYADKILDADIQLFLKHSSAHINSTSEFCWMLTKIARRFSSFLFSISSMIISIVSIYKVAGNIVFPILIIYILAIFGTKYLYKKFQYYDSIIDDIRSKRKQEIENIVQGFMEVRSFNKVSHHKKEFHKYNNETMNTYLKRSNIEIKISIFFESIDTIGILSVLLYSLKKISEGLLNPAQGMTLITFVYRLINPMSDMVNFINELSDNLSMAGKFEEIMNYVNNVKDDGNIKLTEFTDSLEIKNVDFKYGDSKDVLQGINIKIEKCKRIGICGISGSGKSTIFKLLNRFYDPTNGSIVIDNINIKDITMDSYRRMIGSVHQENYIFPGSIKDNIVYGVSSYTEEEFLNACKKANIYDFAMEQEKKFDTVVGPRGLKLSGGQKQRIALARLLLVNPEIILLDEATSSLDNESEYMIQKAIDGLGDKTIVAIAHRLSTIKNYDVIYVIGKSKVLEYGTHNELMEKKGEYYNMVKIAEKNEM